MGKKSAGAEIDKGLRGVMDPHTASGRVVFGMDAEGRIDGDADGHPILFIGLSSNADDNYVAQREIPAESALNAFIGSHLIPGGTLREADRKHIRKSLEGWRKEVEKALKRLEAIPRWDGEPKKAAAAKAKKAK